MPPSISIPQSCPATWNDMTPVPGGRHCGACKKVVVDFTQLSEAEVLAYLQQHPAACGRFRATQLRPHSTWAPWLVAAVVVLSACETESQLTNTSETLTQQASQPGFSIRGKVVDQHTGQPLGHALIISEQDTTLHTRTLSDGTFQLLLPPQLLGTQLVAAVDQRRRNAESDLGLYLPQYFMPDGSAFHAIALRNPGPVIGNPALEPNECFSPAVLPYILPQAPPPPPPKLMPIQSSYSITKAENESE